VKFQASASDQSHHLLVKLYCSVFQPFCCSGAFHKCLELLTEPCAMIQVSVLLQLHRTVVANFVPGDFGLFRRNPCWKTLQKRM